MFQLLRSGVFREYVAKHLADNTELFMELAEADEGDESRYPDFDSFFEGLDTRLDKGEVRRWIRFEVRDRVADLRGRVFPGVNALGDYQEDAQLQEAARQLLETVGVDIRTVPEFKGVLKISFQGQENQEQGKKPKKG